MLTASLTGEPVQVLEQVDGTSCCASSPVLLRRWYVPSLRVARHRVEVENADGFGLHACGKAWLPFTHGGRYGFGLHRCELDAFRYPYKTARGTQKPTA